MDSETICNRISAQAIKAAVEVHRLLGPGLLESVYEEALARELAINSLRFERQKSFPVTYKGHRLGTEYRVDFVVERRVVLELKSVGRLEPIHEAQLLTYLRLSGLWLGLLINFNEHLLTRGIRRVVHGFPDPA